MFATLYLPKFPLQAVLRFRPELWQKPVAVIDAQTPAKSVIEATDAAAKAGVHPGVTSSQAMARAPRILLIPRSLAEEAAASNALLELACSLSAFVENSAPGICTLDLERIAIADFRQWAEKVVASAKALQFQLQVGIAANPDLSLLAARRAEPVLIVHDRNDFLAELPVSVLGPTPEIESILHDWGMHDVGAFTRLSKEQVAERLGLEGKKMWEQAHGRTNRLLNLVRPAETFEEAFDFEREIETTEPLLFILRRFCDQLSLRLQTCYKVAQTLTLSLLLANDTSYERSFRIPAPTSNPDVLFRILDTHLEQLRLEHAPVGVRLTADPAKSTREQFQFFENPLQDPNRFWETLARLEALLGRDQVGVPAPLPTYRPDRFHLQVPEFAPDEEDEEGNLRSFFGAVGLPLRRYRPAIPAQVTLTTTSQPFDVAAEKLSGRIFNCIGPYRLSGDWWDTQTWSAEWWDIELPGQGLYRLGKLNGSWFVEGCYEQQHSNAIAPALR